MNNLKIYVICLLLLISGVILLFQPITVLRLLYRWPRYLYSKVLKEEDIRPRVREALRLIEEDVNLYESRFPIPIKTIRITGIVALVMFLLSLCILSGISS